MAARVAFLGLGVMGHSMARNLLKGGAELTVYNRTPGRAAELVGAGAKEAFSPAEAANGAEFVFSCLGDGASVERTLLGMGPESAVEGMQSGTIVVDHTTIAPHEAEKIAAGLKKRGVEFLDAPVTGGDVGARDGTLTIMVGGDESAFHRAQPLLGNLGTRIERIGPSGTGQRMKSINQVAVALNNIGLTESLAMALNGGIDPEQMLRLLGSGAAGSWALSNYGPRLLAGRIEPGFFAAHMLKDLKIAREEGERSGVELPGVDLGIRLYQELCQLDTEAAGGAVKSGAELGSHAVIKLYQKNYGSKGLPE